MKRITIAVTGGIATGKSTWTKLASAAADAPHLSCDDVVHQTYDQSDVLEAIGQRYGDRAFVGGVLNRRAIGEIIFADDSEREWLEGLLHPRVLTHVRNWRDDLEAPVALIEVPLLYEVDFPLERDIDVVVACSPQTQLSRYLDRNPLDRDQAEARIAAQLPITEKVDRADVVIWNEGSESHLKRQANLAASWITTLSS